MSKQFTIHIIGAGVSGLAAAVSAVDAGHNVCVYEASGYAGGRCRSYYDKRLQCVIDNGNHLILGANKHVLGLIKRIGAGDMFDSITSGIECCDVQTGDRWKMLPDKFLGKRSRIPDVRVIDYIRSLALLVAKKQHVVDDVIAHNTLLYKRLWQPLVVSMLNTSTSHASAEMFRHLMFKLFVGGSAALTSYIPKISWGEGLIDPAIRYIQQHQGKIHLKARLCSVEYSGTQARKLVFADKVTTLGEQDKVIIAVPAYALQHYVPNIGVPQQHNAIVNVHFKTCLTTSKRLWGVVGGTADWFFVKPHVVASTTSAADHLVGIAEDELAARMWCDMQRSLQIDDVMPPYRMLIEKRATFACTPLTQQQRPENNVGYDNLAIAGDYTNTSLPATLESAVISGQRAYAALEAACKGR